MGMQRVPKPPMHKLDKEQWQEYKATDYDHCLPHLRAAGDDPVKRLRAWQQGTRELVEKLVIQRDELEKRNAQKNGRPSLAKGEKISNDIVRWRNLAREIERHGRCQRGKNRTDRIKALRPILQRNLGSNEERAALVARCHELLAEAELKFQAYCSEQGDGIIAEMEDAVQHSEGGAQIGIFEVLREAMGKEARRKIRRHDEQWKQEIQAKRDAPQRGRRTNSKPICF